MKEDAQPVLSESADAECTWLKAENARLRQLLAKHNIQVPPAHPAIQPSVKAVEVLSPDERKERARKRIALFRRPFSLEGGCLRVTIPLTDTVI